MASVGGDSGETLSLNLMPMLDIFSILVCFLLMSFSTDPVNHDVHEQIQLPQSHTVGVLDEVPIISVTKNAIFVHDKKLVDLVHGDVPEKDRSQGAVLPIFLALKNIAEQNKKIAKKIPDATKDKPEQAVTMEMHEDHSFRLLKRIMLSAEQADFIKFKLLVSKNDAP